MKKITLFFVLMSVLTLNAQDFWTEIAPFPVSNLAPKQISIVNNNVVWVYTSRAFSSTIDKWSVSTDGGFTWQNGDFYLGSTNLNVCSIFGISATKAYITAYDATGSSTINSGGVWMTQDAGISWVKQTSAAFNNASSFPNFIHFFDQNNGVVAGDPINGVYEIYTTNNGGSNWTAVSSANIPFALGSNEWGLTLNFNTYNNNIWFGTSYGRIFKSSNQGLSWTATQSPVSDFGGTTNLSESAGFTYKNENEGILINNFLNIFRTLDGGQTWNDETSTVTGVLRNFKTVYVPMTANTIFAWGADINDERGSSYSTDGGNNWINLNTQTDVIPLTTTFNSGTSAFCVGFTSADPTLKFYKLTDPLYRLNSGSLNSDGFDLISNATVSPNPSNGIFNVKSKDVINQIEIFDIAGKKIKTIVINALSEISLNISELENGIYFARLSTDNKNNSLIKLIKN